MEKIFTLHLQMSHISVCKCVFSVCVCMCVSVCVCWTLSGGGSYLRGGQRKGEGGHMWPPTCLWPFIKPGGVEEREGLTVTDRALCETRGGPCCLLLTQTAPPCAAQKNGASMQTASAATPQVHLHHIHFELFFFFFLLRIPHWTSRLGKAMPKNGQHSAPTTKQEWHMTHPTDTRDMLQHPSDRTQRRERLKPNWEWSRTHWECESGRVQPAAAWPTSGS